MSTAYNQDLGTVLGGEHRKQECETWEEKKPTQDARLGLYSLALYELDATGH